MPSSRTRVFILSREMRYKAHDVVKELLLLFHIFSRQDKAEHVMTAQLALTKAIVSPNLAHGFSVLMALPTDTTIDIAIGIVMAVLALVTIGQFAYHASRHERRRRSPSILSNLLTGSRTCVVFRR